MALFQSYAPPGVYTSVIIEAAGQPLFGNARIPVIIGEGTQFFTRSNVELFRGSSSVQDDQAVNENISNQVTGLTRSFTATYTPITDGTGKGTVTNDPTKIQVMSIDADGNQIPLTVISLNGTTGVFTTQLIPPTGTELLITYNFKRGDTQVVNEDDSAQIPDFAKLTINATGVASPFVANGSIVLSTTLPGAQGNLTTLTLVDEGAGNGVPDALAVSGIGTDAIAINIRKPGDVIRTLVDLQTLVEAGIATLSSGELTVKTAPTSAASLASAPAAAFTGGKGGSSNTIFKTQFTPVVDGSNGGVVTTDPTKVIAKVNGIAVVVAAVDGQHGLVTLANPVAFGSSLTFTYFYNTWPNTFDLLPASNVQSIIQVGLGPNRSDFVQGTDYVLGVDADGNGTINWGASVNSAVGVSAAGELANFTPSEVLTTLEDEYVYLRPTTGVIDGKNTVFTLQDVPTDGSGRSVTTDNPTLVAVWVGQDPLEAWINGPAKVVRLSGASQQVTLYNPPAVGNSVFASYYRNTLADHQYAVAVVNPGSGGFGTFTITDELGRIAPLVKFSSGSVAQSAGFADTGIVYPFATPDLYAQAGAAIDETITLTFNDDGNSVLVPAVQATLALNTGGGTLTFTATNPGLVGNQVKIAVDATTLSPTPVVVNGNTVTIFANWNGTPQTLAQIAAYFPSPFTTDGGAITCAASGTTSATFGASVAATALTGGTNAVTVPVTHSYTVSSNQATGGSAGKGYLNQTYIDVKTGFRLTVIDPQDHASFGVPSIPTTYNFEPGDTLTFTVDATSAVRHAGTPGIAPAEANNLNAIQGLHTVVVSTFQSTADDTVVVSTFNKSGNNPNIGEFYFVTFTVAKTAADYALKVYTNVADAYTAYGQPTTTANRLSIGIQLMVQNGAQSFAAVQVPVVPGTNQATDSDFIAAIQSLAKPLPGSQDFVDVIVPLSTSATVQQFLSRFLITQAAPRIEAEAIGFVGFDQFTTAAQAQSAAQGFANSRLIAIANPVAGIILTDSQTGVAVEESLSGEFMAAAMAGLNVDPANDVATTLTFQNLVGFSRLLKTFDPPTMDQMAAAGLTVLLDNNGALKIRHYKSTDPSNPITSEPTSTTTVDYTRQQFRLDNAQFIGRKLVDSLVADVTVVCNARLASLVNQQILSGYKNLSVVPDSSDPTTVNVSVDIKPMFSVLYINVVFGVTTTL